MTRYLGRLVILLALPLAFAMAQEAPSDPPLSEDGAFSLTGILDHLSHITLFDNEPVTGHELALIMDALLAERAIMLDRIAKLEEEAAILTTELAEFKGEAASGAWVGPAGPPGIPGP